MIEPSSDRGEPRASAPQLVAGLVRGYWPWLAGLAIVLAGVAFLLWGAGHATRPRLGVDQGPSRQAAAALRFADKLQGVGQRCLKLLVADTPEKRESGLRYRESELGAAVDGMLFVADAPTRAAFTMAGVSSPLALGFYDAAGKPAGRYEMQPCSGSIASCPTYPPATDWSWAIETAPGKLPDGALHDCTQRTG